MHQNGGRLGLAEEPPPQLGRKDRLRAPEPSRPRRGQVLGRPPDKRCRIRRAPTPERSRTGLSAAVVRLGRWLARRGLAKSPLKSARSVGSGGDAQRPRGPVQRLRRRHPREPGRRRAPLRNRTAVAPAVPLHCGQGVSSEIFNSSASHSTARCQSLRAASAVRRAARQSPRTTGARGGVSR